MNKNSWWKEAVIYQIYPRSFKDSTGNGIGDLQGIISKLDYLKDLGINAIWISPCFPSPMKDFGYDITNYCDIEPLFGTLKDMDLLIAESHERDIKVILDYVANHTSDDHPWFKESRKSKQNPKSDWYIWKDAKSDGSVPNNWICVPGGSAWEWCEERKQYYYHSFLSCQPDVNWANPELRESMLNVLRFWLDRGIDGFRIDMISWLFKDPEWRDNPPNPNYNPKIDLSFQKLLPKYTIDLPGLFDYLELISKTVNSYEDRVIIGEISYGSKLDSYPKYYGSEGNLIHIPAMFEFIKEPWNREVIFNILRDYYSILPPYAWPNFQLGNHDRSRVASRWDGREIARTGALLLLTLKGTSFIYNGEEIGMVDVKIPENKVVDPTSGTESKLARDACRTPMQWDTTINAGFSISEPWLPISPDYKENNVAQELLTQDSMLHLYKELLKLRNGNKALRIGEIKLEDSSNPNCLFYSRLLNSKKEYGIIINFSGEYQEMKIDSRFTIVINTYLDEKTEKKEENLILRKNEGVIIKYL